MSRHKDTIPDESAKLLSNHFLAFLNSHPLISVTGLEKCLGMPSSTLRQALTGKRDIPEKYFYQLGLVLRGYGFDWP